MFTAGLKQRCMSIAPMLSYGSILVVLAALTMAQTGMLPSSEQTMQARMSHAVTGNEIIAYLVQLHGKDVFNESRYQAVIARMQTLGDRPVTAMGWSYKKEAESASLPAGTTDE